MRQADRRRRILDAARRLFLERGYEGTSMEAVQRAAGGSKATVYAHFPGKERLFEAVLADVGGDPLACELAPDMPAAAVLARAADKVLQVAASPWFAQVQRCVLGRAEASPEAARAFFERCYGEPLRGLEGWLRAQHRQGALHCPSPARSAERFLGMVQGLQAQRALFGLPPLEAAARGAWIRHAVRDFLRLHQRP